MAEVNSSGLDEIFDQAAKHLQEIASKLDSDQLLEFYGLFKQATSGPCDSPKPKWYETKARHKWEAWNKLKDMTREQAITNYLHELSKVDPTWEEDVETNNTRGWINVSTLPRTEAELNDIDKTFLDWVKEGNEGKVKDMLAQNKVLVNSPDSEGLLPIHWAADRGHQHILEYLIQNGADVDSRDADGQTPLHYAASCGHLGAAKYLISVGAQSLPDNDGFKPEDVADDIISAMF